MPWATAKPNSEAVNNVAMHLIGAGFSDILVETLSLEPPGFWVLVTHAAPL
jgi:hypothetical protein